MGDKTFYTKIKKTTERTPEGDYLVLGDGSKMSVLNEIAYFIWSNCNGGTAIDLANLVYDNIIDKDDISFETIFTDTKEILKQLVQLELILERE